MSQKRPSGQESGYALAARSDLLAMRLIRRQSRYQLNSPNQSASLRRLARRIRQARLYIRPEFRRNFAVRIGWRFSSSAKIISH